MFDTTLLVGAVEGRESIKTRLYFGRGLPLREGRGGEGGNQDGLAAVFRISFSTCFEHRVLRRHLISSSPPQIRGEAVVRPCRTTHVM